MSVDTKAYWPDRGGNAAALRQLVADANGAVGRLSPGHPERHLHASIARYGTLCMHHAERGQIASAQKAQAKLNAAIRALEDHRLVTAVGVVQR